MLGCLPPLVRSWLASSLNKMLQNTKKSINLTELCVLVVIHQSVLENERCAMTS